MFQFFEYAQVDFVYNIMIVALISIFLYIHSEMIFVLFRTCEVTLNSVNSDVVKFD